MYRLNVYVPESHIDAVKDAMFAAGGGRLGQYEACAWQTLGRGQFEPQAGSHPYIGQQCRLEQVDEYKVEILCTRESIKPVILALKETHPYEEPAFDVYEVVDLDRLI